MFNTFWAQTLYITAAALDPLYILLLYNSYLNIRSVLITYLTKWKAYLSWEILLLLQMCYPCYHGYLFPQLGECTDWHVTMVTSFLSREILLLCRYGYLFPQLGDFTAVLIFQELAVCFLLLL